MLGIYKWKECMPDVLHLQSNLFNMQRLIKLRSFKALFSRDIINASLRNILDNCIEDIVRLCKTATDSMDLFRTLQYTRFQLNQIQMKSPYQDNLGEKCGRVALCY